MNRRGAGGNVARPGPVNREPGKAFASVASFASFASFVFPVRVYFEDTDAAGIAYYASYLRFLERARTEWLRALGYGQQQLRDSAGIGFAVRALSIDYHRPARLDDALDVVSQLREVGRAQLVFDQRIEREATLLASALVRVACVEVQRMKPVALPAALRHAFGQLT